MESEFQTPIIMYGYEIIIPPSHFHSIVNSMYDINDLLEKPFQIRCILPTVYHDSLHHPMNYRIAKLVIGFVPDDQLAQLTANRNQLHEFLTDNPMLDGIEWMPHAKFYTGLEWYPETDSEEDEEDEEDKEDEEEDGTLAQYISKYYM